MPQRNARLDFLEMLAQGIAGELEVIIRSVVKEARKTFAGVDVEGCIPDKVGFIVLMFDFDQGSWMTYASNADRASVVQALKEFIEKDEAGKITGHGEPIVTEH